MRWVAIITALGAMTLMPAPLAAQNTSACSAAALPEAERRAMQMRFQQIAQRQGRAAAETYAREQAHAFRQRLIAEGVCSENDAPQPSPRQPPQARPSPPASSGSRDEGPRCRVENRALPDLNGGMNLVLVTVCD